MTFESSWPPGGDDPLLDSLAEAHVRPGPRLDLAGALADGRLGRVALVSSFGAEAAALLHMVAQAAPATPVLFLDTWQHFPETLAYRDRLVAELGLEDVRSLTPDAATLADEDPRGDLHARDPDMCCLLRKSFPLQDALTGFDSWITGRKRYQGGARSALPFFERDGGHVKINPLAAHEAADMAAYFERHDLPRHPLVAQGYPSIGCLPCTRAVAAGESARAGRWSGMEKTECGIHLGPDGRFVRSKGS